MHFKELLLKIKLKEYEQVSTWPGEQPTEIPIVPKDSKYLKLIFAEYYVKVQDWQEKYVIYNEEVMKNNKYFRDDCISCIENTGLNYGNALKLFEFVSGITEEKEKLVEYLLDILGCFNKILE